MKRKKEIEEIDQIVGVENGNAEILGKGKNGHKSVREKPEMSCVMR